MESFLNNKNLIKYIVYLLAVLLFWMGYQALFIYDGEIVFSSSYKHCRNCMDIGFLEYTIAIFVLYLFFIYAKALNKFYFYSLSLKIIDLLKDIKNNPRSKK